MGGYGPAGGAYGGGLFGSMAPGGDLFSNSEIALNRESRGGVLSVWSSRSRSYFSGLDDALSLNGDVRTTMVGADYSRGALTVGLSAGRTLGLGGYSGLSGGKGRLGFPPEFAKAPSMPAVPRWPIFGWLLPAVSGPASRFLTLLDPHGLRLLSINTGFSGVFSRSRSAPEVDALSS